MNNTEITIEDIRELLSSGGYNSFNLTVRNGVKAELLLCSSLYAYMPECVRMGFVTVKEVRPDHTLVFNDDEEDEQVIQFVSQDKDGNTIPGITNEQVLTALIARMMKLDSECPCEENKHVLYHMEEALMWLCKRTLRLHNEYKLKDK